MTWQIWKTYIDSLPSCLLFSNNLLRTYYITQRVQRGISSMSTRGTQKYKQKIIMQCDKYSVWDQEKVSEDFPQKDWLILKLKRNSWGMKRKRMINMGNCCSAFKKKTGTGRMNYFSVQKNFSPVAFLSWLSNWKLRLYFLTNPYVWSHCLLPFQSKMKQFPNY